MESRVELRARARASEGIQNYSWCQVRQVVGDVVHRRVVLRYIVALIVWARHPIMPKLELRNLIAEPMETHVHGICPLGGNGVVDYAKRRCVVCLNWGGGLWMAHFSECVAGGDCRAAVDVEGANFGFRGR